MALKVGIYTLMTLTGQNSILLNLVQEFIEIQDWLLLTFFIHLHNQLSSAHSISNINKKSNGLDKILHQVIVIRNGKIVWKVE